MCFDPAARVDAGLVSADGGGTTSECPTADAAMSDLTAYVHADDFSVVSGPTTQGSQCCYVIQPVEYCEGRPFLVEDRALTAPASHGSNAWIGAELPLPEVAGLNADRRAELAELWTTRGLAEHASIASFARFALELLAVGAPTDLVHGAR